MKTSIVKLVHLRSPSCVAGILILVDLDAKTIRGAGLHRRVKLRIRVVGSIPTLEPESISNQLLAALAHALTVFFQLLPVRMLPEVSAWQKHA